ncbi:MAG: succinate dehydrogenase, cytochrome b556 subunit [Caulobacterales bacterium]|uniref:succinate dehydrogenase, cytochrome b556 subunit n=1 Tax=Glycocaulis sp. TaxID=1969725 RepID=UPI003FA00597
MATRPNQPLSPHLQVWRWHATMASSILHRATGIANYVGAILVSVWLVLLAAGPETYAIWEGLMAGPLGLLVIAAFVGFTFSVSYHLLNGLRHLAWDAGLGFDAGGSNLRSWAIIGAAAGFTAVIWIAGGMI